MIQQIVNREGTDNTSLQSHQYSLLYHCEALAESRSNLMCFYNPALSSFMKGRKKGIEIVPLCENSRYNIGTSSAYGVLAMTGDTVVSQ